MAGGVTLASKLPDLRGGEAAKLQWASTLVLGLVVLLGAGALAVWAVLPTPFRIAVHVDELDSWVTRRVLERNPTQIRGELLSGSVIAVRDARAIIEAKADRLKRAFYAFAAALSLIIAAGASIAVYADVREARSRTIIERRHPIQPPAKRRRDNRRRATGHRTRRTDVRSPQARSKPA